MPSDRSRGPCLMRRNNASKPCSFDADSCPEWSPLSATDYQGNRYPVPATYADKIRWLLPSRGSHLELDGGAQPRDSFDLEAARRRICWCWMPNVMCSPSTSSARPRAPSSCDRSTTTWHEHRHTRVRNMIRLSYTIEQPGLNVRSGYFEGGFSHDEPYCRPSA
jgi:hypothetical protein